VEGAHWKEVDGEVLAALDLHGEGVPAISGGDEGHDGVQLERVMTMVCRAGILASCIDEGRRLELADASAMHKASMSTGDAEGSGLWGSYQEV
jgi:hypothetical protein